jgi:hypothetical protein
MPARAEVRQVLGMDADKFELQFGLFEGDFEKTVAQAGLLGDVIFDAILYILCYHVWDRLGGILLVVT